MGIIREVIQISNLGKSRRPTIVRKHRPIRMENGKINWVLMLNGSSSFMTKTISGVKNDRRFMPVVWPTKTDGIIIPLEFWADMCSEIDNQRFV